MKRIGAATIVAKSSAASRAAAIVAKLSLATIVASFSLACSSRVREQQEVESTSKATPECDAYANAMATCLKRAGGEDSPAGRASLAALRSSLRVSSEATASDVVAMRKRCATGRTQLEESCR